MEPQAPSAIPSKSCAAPDDERTLRECAEQYNLFQESVKDYAIFMMDAAGKVVNWNAGAERILGYEESEIVGRSFAAFFTPEDRAAGIPEQELRQAAETGRASDDRWHVRKDGSRLWCSGVTSALRDNGSLRGYAKVMRDLTERERSENRFRSLVEHSWDAVALSDEAGIVRYVSPASNRIIGWGPDELVGRNSFDLIHPDELPWVRQAFAELLQKPGASATAVYRFRHKDGSWRWLEGTSTNLLYVPGVQAMVGNYHDVTERRQLVEALQQRNEELTETNRRKDEFLAMLAHELRNPLAPILNGLHIMRQDRSESPVLKQARLIIERQVQNMVRLVDDLLDVSRITRGKIQLRKERVELRAVVDRALESVRTIVDARRHQVALTAPPEPIWLEGDPTRLEQVFTNLLTNAAKYTDPGGRIGLTVERAGPEVIVKVRDNGIGIAPKMVPHIFDLFTQADRALDRSQGGLGIGLTVVKRLVEMHGGTVSAASAGPGKGSEFTVRLPGLAFVADAPPQEVAPAARRGQHPLRVLVVEDNVDAAESVALLLRLYGHEVQVVHTGPAGLEAAHAFRPHVVLLDIGLPGMDGYEVAKRIRQDAELRRIPLIAMTGYSREEDRARSREAGIDQHLVKPVEPEKLQELLTLIDYQRGPLR